MLHPLTSWIKDEQAGFRHRRQRDEMREGDWVQPVMYRLFIECRTRGGEPKKKKRVRAPDARTVQVLHIFSQCSFQLPRESATSRPVDLSFCPGSKSEGNLIGFRISVRRINFPCFSQERSSQLAGQSADHTERRTTRQSFGNSTYTRDSGARAVEDLQVSKKSLWRKIGGCHRERQHFPEWAIRNTFFYSFSQICPDRL